jgi:hypothetical protein
MATKQGTGVTGISDYLVKNLLPTITSLNADSIYDYEPLSLAGYPAATVTIQSITGKVGDNARNERHYIFTINVYMDRSAQNLGAEEAESIMRSISDQLISLVDDDPTLGGNCIIAKPLDATYLYANRESNNIRVMQVTLDCRDVSKWR